MTIKWGTLLIQCKGISGKRSRRQNLGLLIGCRHELKLQFLGRVRDHRNDSNPYHKESEMNGRG